MFPFANVQAPQPVWSPETMYSQTNLQPYQSEAFLNQVFNFNEQSIAAYQTLPHELKLQFFLSVEEMKLLGYMSDKARYQGILQEIARRKLILQKPSATVSSGQSKRKQSEQWGTKLENLCDDHLKKLQKDNFLDDIPINYAPTHQEVKEVDFLSGQNEDEEFQWAQSGNEKPVLVRADSNQQQMEKLRHKSFDQLFVHKEVKAEKQKAPEKVEHIDVWDLEVIDEEPKNRKQPSFQKSQQSRKSINEIKLQEPFQPMVLSNGPQSAPDVDNFDLDYFKTQTKPIEPIATNNGMVTSIHEIEHVEQPQMDKQEQSEQIDNATNIETNEKEEAEDEFQWQEGTQGNPMESQPGNQLESLDHPVQNHVELPIEQPADPPISGFLSSITKIEKQEPSYNFFQPLETPVSAFEINTELISGPPKKESSGIYVAGPGFDLDLTAMDHGFTFPTPEVQNSRYEVSVLNSQYFPAYTQPEKQQEKQDNRIEQSVINPAILPVIDLHLLEPLRKRPPLKALTTSLNKKFFDFDRVFYQEALNLIQALGYEHNPDYGYIKEQSDACQQIFRLTQLYTAAVDQDKEEEVMESLRKSKQLYMKLDTKKTANTMRKYVKMEGKSLSYEIGRLSLEAGVPKDLIEKAIKNPKFNETATLLYLMVFFGNTYSISLFACQVMEYVQQINKDMEELLENVKGMDEKIIHLIRESKKFVEYKENIHSIMALAKRILELGTICVRDQLSPNTQKVYGIISKLVPQSHAELIPNYFLTFFANFACSNCSNIYTLHSQMQEFIEQHPLCSLCLESIQELSSANSGQKKEDNKYYHFKCWNFRVTVTEFKRKLMEEMELRNKIEEQNRDKIEEKVEQ